MDDRRFDSIARSLASGTNRRQILKGLLGLGAGSIVATVTVTETDAARRGYSGPSTPNGPEYETKVCPRPSCCAMCPTDFSVLNQFAICVLRTSQTCAECAQAVGCRIA